VTVDVLVDMHEDPGPGGGRAILGGVEGRKVGGTLDSGGAGAKEIQLRKRLPKRPRRGWILA
jgi:hypothetical protein